MNNKIYSYYFGRYMNIHDIRKERRKAYINQDYRSFDLTLSLEQKLFKTFK